VIASAVSEARACTNGQRIDAMHVAMGGPLLLVRGCTVHSTPAISVGSPPAAAAQDKQQYVADYRCGVKDILTGQQGDTAENKPTATGGGGMDHEN